MLATLVSMMIGLGSCVGVVLIAGVKEKLGHDLRTVLTFVVFGQLFSPVLHTLTDTISTDTIYTTTFFMLLVHLIYFDYGVSAAIVSNSLSLSAAVFASICLASRLPSAHHAFILMTVATETFVLFPLLRKELRKPINAVVTVLFAFAVLLIIIQKEGGSSNYRNNAKVYGT
ncbi:hypothetical protein NQ317_002976 [Molorchus minor]|uniref:Uncharacterized protein n=1 Tax=Molorchus minor TaxID=1323400 RepID=A0ABQ9J6R1_9CUCU|nr:hypothetical protein NQ317_002976 [Molorchus minor]